MNAALDTAPAPAPHSRGGSRGRWRVLGFVTGIVLAVLALVLAVTVSGLLSHDPAPKAAKAAVPAAWTRPVVSKAGLVDRLGIRITQVAVTGEGGLIDLRYQIIDPNKAAALHDADTPPAVVDEETGAVANDLFMNHAHSGPYAFGETYYLIFDNPGNLIQRGGYVSVLLANTEVDHVRVG